MKEVCTSPYIDKSKNKNFPGADGGDHGSSSSKGVDHMVGVVLAASVGLIAIITLGIFLKRWAFEAFKGHQRHRRDPSSSSSSRNLIQFTSLPSSASAADQDEQGLVVETLNAGATAADDYDPYAPHESA
mmetsp:Transcript_22809/g.44505  ORF Transcript_22809/g.44505 Transcript_22809/m.44505 type:complete len:130 (+) Transcript_22809:931-1320(+)|eukprot:CAMPEP_0167809810 /NCGR_PEP_ID=MMETSP0111_2-20121227/24013_1 /TAXON_ID=91324 /ORGANISM="Lotharella globosa, Strain CCCM811" /LENGTH=129 /DNA_ID=CAMNT_0007708261 /DNA_START=1328 /DNA_END=1717 /DNA_ORIENTATION=+